MTLPAPTNWGKTVTHTTELRLVHSLHSNTPALCFDYIKISQFLQDHVSAQIAARQQELNHLVQQTFGWITYCRHRAFRMLLKSLVLLGVLPGLLVYVGIRLKRHQQSPVLFSPLEIAGAWLVYVALWALWAGLERRFVRQRVHLLESQLLFTLARFNQQDQPTHGLTYRLIKEPKLDKLLCYGWLGLDYDLQSHAACCCAPTRYSVYIEAKQRQSFVQVPGYYHAPQYASKYGSTRMATPLSNTRSHRPTHA